MPNCAITGHRDIPEDKVDYIRERIREEVLLAIQDGYFCYLTGMAAGADQLLAEVIIELRETYPNLFLEAAIPYRNRIKTADQRFQNLLRKCNGVYVASETYFPGCYMKRNRYLIAYSQRVIVVYDGREKGGTLFTMRHAYNMNRDVRVIQY